MSQHFWAQHAACVCRPPCCDMLRRVGCCCLKFDQFQTWANNSQHVATCRNIVAKRTQHVAPNHVATCCVGMFRSFGRGLKKKSLHLVKAFSQAFQQYFGVTSRSTTTYFPVLLFPNPPAITLELPILSPFALPYFPTQTPTNTKSLTQSPVFPLTQTSLSSILGSHHSATSTN